MLIRRFRVGIPIKLSSFTINKWGITNPKLTHLHYLCKYSTISQIPHEKQEDKEEPINKKNHSSSLILSYLINSCGLSSQSALAASKKINIKTAEKSDSVLNILKSYGFTNAHITKLITKLPALLTSNPDATLRPKLEFLLDIGFSNTQLTDLITSCPNLLLSSLENRIRPNFDLLLSVLNNNQQVAAALHRNSHNSCLLRDNLKTNFLPNIRILQGYGVPGPNIAKLAILKGMGLKKKTSQFEATIESIKKMGFNPLSALFLHGVIVKLGMSTATWKRKVCVLKSLGWSEEDVICAFVKQPYCMAASEEKLRRSMDFFVKQMHWSPSIVVANPVLLNLSLEKRVIPRCSVFKVLVSKGLVKNTSVMALKINERDFLNNYVLKYQDRVPEVLQAYNGNLDSVGFQW